MVAAILSAILLGNGACGSANNLSENSTGGATMESESQLLGVRFIGPDNTLKQVEEAASKVGWTEVRHDQAGSILVIAPKPYHFEQFQKLINVLDTVPERDFSLQLIGPDGKPVMLGPPENGD